MKKYVFVPHNHVVSSPILITDIQPESYPFRNDWPFCLISGRCVLRHLTF